MKRKCLAALVVGVAAWFAPTTVRAQAAVEQELVVEAGQVLREIMAIPARGIPRALLADATGLVIVPGMIKGGFVIGVKHGHGIAVTRDAAGAWTAPVFLKITGGSIGWQIGLQATDVILVFKSRNSMERMLRGQFTIGADASVAAGPVGRDVSAATDVQLKAEILSYSRSRGLFAGVALDGAVIQPEPRATAAYYGQTPADPKGHTPASAIQFLQLLNAYSSPQPTATPVVAVHDDRQSLRGQLIAAHQRLLSLLDPAWKQYLAMPQDVFGASPAALDRLKQLQARFNLVAGNPQYRTLVERQEFQETVTLLNRYTLLQEAAAANVLNLPPPPQ